MTVRKAKKLRCAAVFLVLAAVFALLLMLNIRMGSVSIQGGEILRILLHGEDGSAAGGIIWRIRLPRLLAAALLGGALSVSGFLLQTFFHNPIAGPYVLGISSGAKMFAGLMLIVILPKTTGIPYAAVMLTSFAGAMLVTGVVLLFARRARSMATLLVIGVMLGQVCSAVTDFLVNFADDADIVNLHAWSVGSFSAVSWADLRFTAFVILPALAAVFCLSKPIAAYQLGENHARSMGVPIRLFRMALVTLSSLLSAAVTALTGPISFIGIAVPHITRRLFGTEQPIVVIPGSFLCGGVFCMLCDLIARMLFSPTELAISTVTAVFGAPVVIALMLERQRRREHG